MALPILLAFQLDRAYQASQDRGLEPRYLARLGEDLGSDSAAIARLFPTLAAARFEV